MLVPFDLPRVLDGVDTVLDGVHRAHMGGGELVMDDATYRAAFDKIYAAYVQVKAQRIRAAVSVDSAEAARVSPGGAVAGVEGVWIAARKAKLVADTRVLSELILVEGKLARLLTSMHDAFVSGLEADAASAEALRKAWVESV